MSRVDSWQDRKITLWWWWSWWSWWWWWWWWWWLFSNCTWDLHGLISVVKAYLAWSGFSLDGLRQFGTFSACFSNSKETLLKTRKQKNGLRNSWNFFSVLLQREKTSLEVISKPQILVQQQPSGHRQAAELSPQCRPWYLHLVSGSYEAPCSPEGPGPIVSFLLLA